MIKQCSNFQPFWNWMRVIVCLLLE